MRKPFWSDDFDMDLLKLYPHLEQALGKDADTVLWTYGGVTNGRLNHPTVWNGYNGMEALFFTTKPTHERKDGFVSINGMVTNNQLVECVTLELLRDQWSHTYTAIIDVCHIDPLGWKTFEAMMYHVRNLKVYPDFERTKAEIFDVLLNKARTIALMAMAK